MSAPVSTALERPSRAPATRPARREPAAPPPLLPATPVRVLALLALGAFGAVHWAGLVEPAPRGALLPAVALAVLGALALRAASGLSAPARHPAGALVAVLTVAACAVGAGLPVELLAPARLGVLADGGRQGLEALPDLRVPYAGVDPWPRWVILAGGGLLLALGGLLSAGSRSAGGLSARRRTGAALALAVLYAVPAVELSPGGAFARGAAFAILLGALLWLERVPRRGGAAAAAGVLAAVGIGLAAAPLLDRDRAWVDYEEIAQSLAPAAGVRFSFDHAYGPISWPRDGREMFRVRARTRSYWKAENLNSFDGRAWRRSDDADEQGAALSNELPPAFADRREWRQRLRVTVRGLRSGLLIGAGTTFLAGRAPSAPRSAGSPGSFELERPLRRGHSYEVDVFVPRPSEAELSVAGTVYPELAREYLELTIPDGRPAGAGSPAVRAQAGAQVSFAPWGSGREPEVYDGGLAPAEELLESSPHARAWALAQRLRRGASSPHQYVRRVLAFLRTGFVYDETPPGSPRPLDAFLFDHRRGYCQHFSGAMALLLRMGGVPARVAAGFSPGSYSRRREDYVVRDVDAHSWVEAYFPGLGWVTFDPTPPDSPARSQDIPVPSLPGGAPAAGSAGRGDVPEPGRAAPAPGAARPRGGGEGGPPWTAAGIALLTLALGGLGTRRLRGRPRRRPADGDPALQELRRAFARTGRPLAADTTLLRLEARLETHRPAARYVRELAAARYGFATPPRPARRALRRALAAGGGLTGRLRALWALPPRP